MKPLSLKDKVALVTGGARGIGRAIVEAFAERGVQVIVADIDEERAAGLAVQIGQPSSSVRLDAGAIGTIEGTVHEAASAPAGSTSSSTTRRSSTWLRSSKSRRKASNACSRSMWRASFSSSKQSRE